MKPIIIFKIIIFSVLIHKAASQNLIVEYEFKDYKIPIKAQLITYESYSLYSVFYSLLTEQTINEGNEFNSHTVEINPAKDLHFIKNFQKRDIKYKGGVFNKSFFVTDSLDTFHWKILQDTVSILGIKCQKAETSFRGRNYEAYFTTDIKVPDGPWKFNGLPGLILRIFSLDDTYSFEAKSIEVFEDTLDIEKFTKDYKGDLKDLKFTEFSELSTQKLSDSYLKQKAELSQDGVTFKTISLEVFFEYPED